MLPKVEYLPYLSWTVEKALINTNIYIVSSILYGVLKKQQHAVVDEALDNIYIYTYTLYANIKIQIAYIFTTYI